MPETQQTISEWAVATFGGAGTNASVTVRALREAAELLQLLVRPDGQADPAKIVEECADVCIVIVRNCERRGIQWDAVLPERIARKRYEEELDMHLKQGTKPNPVDWAMACTMELAILVDGNRPPSQDPREGMTNSEFASRMRNVSVTLHSICWYYGFQLWLEVEKKMEINRKREWKLDGAGHGQHVAPEDYRHTTSSKRTPLQKAEEIARRIENDLNNRYWLGIDNVDEDIKEEIRAAWRTIAFEEIVEAEPG